MKNLKSFFFAATNHYDNIDEAIKRKGRKTYITEKNY